MFAHFHTYPKLHSKSLEVGEKANIKCLGKEPLTNVEWLESTIQGTKANLYFKTLKKPKLLSMKEWEDLNPGYSIFSDIYDSLVDTMKFIS